MIFEAELILEGQFRFLLLIFGKFSVGKRRGKYSMD